MRYDAIEVGMAHRAARRRNVKRMMRSIIGAPKPATDAAIVARATDAVDEAFAGMSHDNEPSSKNLDVLSHLAEQLEALEQQRDKLVQLLRDIES